MIEVPELRDAACRLVDEAGRQGIRLRLLGGLAVSLTCPSAARPPLARTCADIDFATDRKGGRGLASFFDGLGFQADREVNTLSGHRRQVYHSVQTGKVDIFVEEFEMCHRLPLADRLELCPYTLPPVDLFLTKAQIVDLNRKDLLDLLALLLDNGAGTGCGFMDLDYAAVLCAKDWGLFTTVNQTLERIGKCLHTKEVALDDRQAGVILTSTGLLRQALGNQPKTLGWKARAAVGRRQRWYLEVEEVERGNSPGI